MTPILVNVTILGKVLLGVNFVVKRMLLPFVVALVILASVSVPQTSEASENLKLGYVYSVLNNVGLVETTDGALYMISDLWINLYEKREIGLVVGGGIFDGIGDKILYLSPDLSKVERESTVFSAKEVLGPVATTTPPAPIQAPTAQDKKCTPYTVADAFNELGYPNLAKGDHTYTDSKGQKHILLPITVDLIKQQAEGMVKSRGGCK